MLGKKKKEITSMGAGFGGIFEEMTDKNKRSAFLKLDREIFIWGDGSFGGHQDCSGRCTIWKSGE